MIAFIREYDGERVLVVANLSRFVQHAELDLSRFAGQMPIEMFSRNEFPAAGASPYPLVLGPHDFYWFQLTTAGQPAAVSAPSRLPELPNVRSVDTLLRGAPLAALIRILPGWLRSRRWFGAKARKQRQIALRDVLPLPEVDGLDARLAIFQIDYVEGEPDTYVLPLGIADSARVAQISEESPGAVIAQLPDGRVVYDAMADARSAIGALGSARSIPDDPGSFRVSARRPHRGIPLAARLQPDATPRGPDARPSRATHRWCSGTG